ncbi:MAG: hypothetical protein QXW52_08640 [Candidatus Caldarchaeum sp.]
MVLHLSWRRSGLTRRKTRRASPYETMAFCSRCSRFIPVESLPPENGSRCPACSTILRRGPRDKRWRRVMAVNIGNRLR